MTAIVVRTDGEASRSSTSPPETASAATAMIADGNRALSAQKP